MNPTHPSDNDPDSGDLPIQPEPGTRDDQPEKHDLPDDDAEKLGNFA